MHALPLAIGGDLTERDIAHRSQPLRLAVRHNHECRIGQFASQQARHQSFRFGIERAGGLVEENPVGPRQDQPHQRQALLLADRETAGIFRSKVEPVPQPRDVAIVTAGTLSGSEG